MKEIPILFSTEMVKAILDGRKTQTRRLMKPQPYKEVTEFKIANIEDIPVHERGREIKRPGNIGDVLWVRETFAKLKWQAGGADNPKGEAYNRYYYKCNDPNERSSLLYRTLKWKPSIHMPKEACRLKLEITRLRFQRLQNISQEDAEAEGVEKHLIGIGVNDYEKHTDFITSFSILWAEIYGEQSWKENPWVWIIDFKILK